jgi:hypothetical protein
MEIGVSLMPLNSQAAKSAVHKDCFLLLFTLLCLFLCFSQSSLSECQKFVADEGMADVQCKIEAFFK